MAEKSRSNTFIHASVPEPPPIFRGKKVVPYLQRFLNRTVKLTDAKLYQEVTDIIEARTIFGLEKYGQMLTTNDGRCGKNDALQEFGDLLIYTSKMKLNKDHAGLEELRALLPILHMVIDSSEMDFVVDQPTLTRI